MKEPRFSVVLPVYQGASVVARAVRSILDQEFEDFELIVIDDGSTDESATVAREAAVNDPRARVIQQPNRGRSAARNAGAALAAGTYLVFLDADDEAGPEWLLRLWEVSDSGRAQLVHCGELRVPIDGSPQRQIPTMRYGPLFAYQLGPFLPGTFAVRRTRFLEAGAYEEDLHFGENYELALRLTHAAAKGHWYTTAVDEPLIVRHWEPDRSSYDAARYEYARLLLERHRDKLRAKRGAVAAQYAVLGISASRLGRKREAIQALAHAVANDPLRLRNYGRLAKVAVSRAPKSPSDADDLSA